MVLLSRLATQPWGSVSPSLSPQSISVSNTLSMRGLHALVAAVAAALRAPPASLAVPRCAVDALVMGVIALLRESKLRRVRDWPAELEVQTGDNCTVGNALLPL